MYSSVWVPLFSPVLVVCRYICEDGYLNRDRTHALPLRYIYLNINTPVFMIVTLTTAKPGFDADVPRDLPQRNGLKLISWKRLWC